MEHIWGSLAGLTPEDYSVPGNEPPNKAKLPPPMPQAIRGALNETLLRRTGDDPVMDLHNQLRNPINTTELAMGIMGGPRLMRPAPAPAPNIRAYHGSPHDYAAERLVRNPNGAQEYLIGLPDKLPDVPLGYEVLKDFPLGRVRLDKIGTGEGAQAYGHGWYAAEREGTARRYRDDLSMNLNAHGGKLSPVEAGAAERFYGNRQDVEKTLADLNGRIKNSHMYGDSPESVQQLRDQMKLLQSGWEPPRSRMYEVDIKAKPEQFLDWDRPLAKQSEVGSKLSGVFDPSMTGQQAYQSLIGYRPGQGGGTGFAGKLGADPREASGRFNATGIPGIKYLDQGSRNTRSYSQGMIDNYGSPEAALEKARKFLPNAEGDAAAHYARIIKELETPQSSNYVVFDDKLIDILRKYALPGAVGGAGFGSLAPGDGS